MSWLTELFTKDAKALVDSVGEAFDKNFTSEEERITKKAEVVALINAFVLKVAEVKADLVKTEMAGNWMQRSWRPIIMMSFGFVVIYRYFVAPTFNLPMAELPENFWNLLELGMGGYVIGRSVEKISETVSGNLDKLGKRK